MEEALGLSFDRLLIMMMMMMMSCTLISAFLEWNYVGEEQLFRQPKGLPVFQQTGRCITVSTWDPSGGCSELMDLSRHLKTQLR